jgi:Domain of unknown function (DUF4262)
MRARRPTRETIARHWRELQDDVERTGRTVIGVFPDADSKDPTNDAFMYSVGNALKGLPELLVVGMYRDGYAINALSEIMLERGRKFQDGEVVDLGGPCPVCVVDAAEGVKDRYTCQATGVFGEGGYAVMQVVLPDAAGKFPWDRGCAEPYSRVVVHRARGLQ